jgi:predicted SAM-dependent methyltransferase
MAKYNLGVGPLPIHPQHKDIMVNPLEWVLVDKYIKDPKIKNWDAEVLDEIKDESADTIYASHLLEHISHRRLLFVLSVWQRKLKRGGELILNVPDMEWTARQIIKFNNCQSLDSPVFSEFEGDRGIQSIVYGTHEHEGEHHGSGFTERSLRELLEKVGFGEVQIDKVFEAHDMQCLIVRAKKI